MKKLSVFVIILLFSVQQVFSAQQLKFAHLALSNTHLSPMLSLIEQKLEPVSLLFCRGYDKKRWQSVLNELNQHNVLLTFVYRPVQGTHNIWLSVPPVSSHFLSEAHVAFAGDIARKLSVKLESFGANQMGAIPLWELAGIGSPYVVVHVPNTVDLDKLSSSISSFLSMTFPDYLAEVKPKEPEPTNVSEPAMEAIETSEGPFFPTDKDMELLSKELRQRLVNTGQLSVDHLDLFRQSSNESAVSSESRTDTSTGMVSDDILESSPFIHSYSNESEVSTEGVTSSPVMSSGSGN
jgi:hypothetical protein